MRVHAGCRVVTGGQGVHVCACRMQGGAALSAVTYGLPPLPLALSPVPPPSPRACLQPKSPVLTFEAFDKLHSADQVGTATRLPTSPLSAHRYPATACAACPRAMHAPWHATHLRGV